VQVNSPLRSGSETQVQFGLQDLLRKLLRKWFCEEMLGVSAVQWALACGSGWADWKCEDYAVDRYQRMHFKQQATELLEWAHANGCPCTCGHLQQQQQQQQ
jgi:hypothetical protein